MRALIDWIREGGGRREGRAFDSDFQRVTSKFLQNARNMWRMGEVRWDQCETFAVMSFQKSFLSEICKGE